MAGALSGLKVIDMSRYIAGPFCGQLLGDLGADVVKVERIDGGEEGRRVGEAIAGDTFFFLSANRNKRGFAVDFRDPECQALLADLAAQADIRSEERGLGQECVRTCRRRWAGCALGTGVQTCALPIYMSRYIAGPFCGQLLGDLGADVVKVERIDGGEEGRRVGEAIAGDTFFFLSANRNKRGFAVDFRDPECQALLADLAAQADI